MEAEQRAPQVISSRVTAALLACGMFMPVGLFAPSLVLPQLGRSFAGVAHAEMLTELVGALASFAFAVASPAAGAVIARLGCRRVIATALILFAVGGALPALLNNIWLILVARVGVGIALAAVFTGALVGLGSFPGEQRNRMFGWFSVVGGVTAIFLFPVVAAIGQYGWRPAFLVNLSALLVIPLVLQLPEALGTVAAKKSPIDSEGKQSTGRLVGPAMAGLLAIASLTGMAMLISPIYAPIHLAELGLSDTRLMAMPATLGATLAVFASASYGQLHARIGTESVFALGLLLAAAMLVIAGISTTATIFVAAVVILSATTAMLAPNVSAAAMAYGPLGKGPQAIGLANGVMFGAQIAFPFIALWVRARAGMAGLFLSFGAVFFVAAISVVLLASRWRRRSAG